MSDLVNKKCVPCEGEISPLTLDEANKFLESTEGWEIDPSTKVISKSWVVKNFVAGVDFIKKIADIAEDDNHHPDISLRGYRNVTVDLTTHAIGGLSENDFILAAKINKIPVDLKNA